MESVVYGKTFGAKEVVIRDFLKNQNEFVYLRRYEAELKEALPKRTKFFSRYN